MARKLYSCVCFALLLTAVQCTEISRWENTFLEHNVNLITKLRELVNNTKASSTPEDAISKTAVLNTYVDQHFIPHLNKYIQESGLEPLNLSEIEEKFSWKLFDGSIKLFNGKLGGPHSIKREEDVVMRYEQTHFVLHLPLGFENLLFDYDYNLKFMAISPNGRVEGKSQNNAITVEIGINLVTAHLNLRKFEINDLGSLTVKFSGNSLEDWLVNLLTEVIIPPLKPTIARALEGAANEFINETGRTE